MQSGRGNRKTALCARTCRFFHPDYTVGLGVTPSQHPKVVAGYTASGESHPALKLTFRLLLYAFRKKMQYVFFFFENTRMKIFPDCFFFSNKYVTLSPYSILPIWEDSISMLYSLIDALNPFGSTVSLWATAAVTVVLFWLLSRFCKSWALPFLSRTAERLHLRGLQVLAQSFTKPLPILIALLGVLVAMPTLSPALIPARSVLTRIATLICIGWGLWNATDLCDLALNNLSTHLDLKANLTLTSIFKKVYRFLVVVFVAVGVLDVLDYSVTGLITGFGLAGLTVSLAAQDSASNLFSGLMILLERPFSIGDWITVNGVDGEVEDLTFRSTKIRAMDNTLYVLPNSSVTNATINNSAARFKRLFRFTLNLSFDSSREQLEALMDRLYNHIKATESVDPSSVIVRLTGFNESGVSILVSAYILRKELSDFLSVQNKLNLDILDFVREAGLHFALTASRVYLENESDGEVSSAR